MKPTKELLKAYGWDIPVRFIDGTWYEAVEFRPLGRNDQYYEDTDGTVHQTTAACQVPGPMALILRPVLIPERPDQRWLDRQYCVNHRHDGLSTYMLLGDHPTLTGNTYVTHPFTGDRKVVEMGMCDDQRLHGLRWRVVIVSTDDPRLKPQEPVEERHPNQDQVDAWLSVYGLCRQLGMDDFRSDAYNAVQRVCEFIRELSGTRAKLIPKITRYNPENLPEVLLNSLPAGARLLESREEQQAFAAQERCHEDLWLYNGGWMRKCGGAQVDWTFCTTRPPGWWLKRTYWKAGGFDLYCTLEPGQSVPTRWTNITEEQYNKRTHYMAPVNK